MFAFLGVIYGLFFFADGYTDPFYLRFTSEKQENLILGTSRSAQGILPSVLEKEIDKSFFNFSFTILHSPYGDVYLDAIKHKLKKKSNDQVFILAVDPWSISSSSSDPNDNREFREKDLILDNMHLFNYSPNFEYLLKNLDGNYTNIFNSPKGDNKMFLHKNG